MKKPTFETLEEAKQYLRENWESGVSCPGCGQHVKLYKRAFPIASAVTLIAISKAPVDEDGYVHLGPILDTLSGTAAQGGYAVLSHHWGLIEQKEGLREDGSKRVGYWRITKDGHDFLKGGMISKYALLFNGRCYGITGKGITLREALQNKFNYDELMA